MKKIVYAFLIKKMPLHVGLGSKQQNFEQLRSNLSERTKSGYFLALTSPSLRLPSLFKEPLLPARLTYYLNALLVPGISVKTKTTNTIAMEILFE